MSLFATQYPNNSRVVSGTPAIFKDDVILLCDTSTAAVVINLLEIPDNYWNTTWKLYIVDNSSNASVNNITINAGSGQTINGASSITLSTNDESAVIRISSNNQFVATLSLITGGAVTVINQQNPLAAPNTLTTNLDKLYINGFQSIGIGNDVYLQNDYVKLTYSQVNYLVTNDSLIPNQVYCISDAKFGLNPYDHNVFIKATSVNTLETFGTGEFYNADYKNVGDYSGVSGFVAQLGIWQQTLTPVTGDVVIWNNFNYVNLTGVNTTTTPDIDTTNWSVLTYSITNGYLLEYNKITYLFTFSINNLITSREDKYLNYVEFAIDNNTTGLCSLNQFKWGNPQSNQNKVIANSMFDCCNVIFDSRLSNNYIFNTVVYLTDFTQPSLFKIFNNNSFINSSLETLNPCYITSFSVDNYFRDNFFQDVQNIKSISLNENVIFTDNVFNLVNIPNYLQFDNCEFTFNNLTGGTLTVNQILGKINYNTSNNSIINITNAGEINNNVINNSGFVINANEGFINKNEISIVSDFTVDINGINGVIVGNYIGQKSSVYLQTNNNSFQNNRITNSNFGFENNDGNIDVNTILNYSSVTITDNKTQGKFIYNLISNRSLFVVEVNSGLIGIDNGLDIKGYGNIVSNNAKINIEIINPSSQFFANEIYSTEINISTLNKNIVKCSIRNSLIEFLTNTDFVDLTLDSATYGSGTYAELNNFAEGEYIKGNGSIKAFLDCSDTAIYDSLTNTLNIPNELRAFAGIYMLNNSNGIQIDKIIAINPLIDTSFYNDFGSSTDFTIVSVATAVAGNIIANTTIPTGLFTMEYRASGTDYIKLKKLGNFNGMVEYGIFV